MCVALHDAAGRARARHCRWGRRRPFLAVGVGLSFASVYFMLLAVDLPGYTFAFAVTQVGGLCVRARATRRRRLLHAALCWSGFLVAAAAAAAA